MSEPTKEKYLIQFIEIGAEIEKTMSRWIAKELSLDSKGGIDFNISDRFLNHFTESLGFDRLKGKFNALYQEKTASNPDHLLDFQLVKQGLGAFQNSRNTIAHHRSDFYKKEDELIFHKDFFPNFETYDDAEKKKYIWDRKAREENELNAQWLHHIFKSAYDLMHTAGFYVDGKIEPGETLNPDLRIISKEEFEQKNWVRTNF